MKLIKRGFDSQPLATITLWLIPTMTYIFQKFNGLIYHREWVWWVGIPTMFLIWLLINWKIENGKKYD